MKEVKRIAKKFKDVSSETPSREGPDIKISPLQESSEQSLKEGIRARFRFDADKFIQERFDADES